VGQEVLQIACTHKNFGIQWLYSTNLGGNMNEGFYQFALDIIENLTTDEIEVGLLEFGIECKRKDEEEE
jgi:hypothetical protein